MKYQFNSRALIELAGRVACYFPHNGRTCIAQREHALEHPESYLESEVRLHVDGGMLCPSCLSRYLAAKVHDLEKSLLAHTSHVRGSS